MTAQRRTWGGRGPAESRGAARSASGRHPRCAHAGQVLPLERALPFLCRFRRSSRARSGNVVRLHDARPRSDWVAFVWMSLALAGCLWLVADPDKAGAPRASRVSHVTALARPHVLEHTAGWAVTLFMQHILWWIGFGAVVLLALAGLVVLRNDLA